MLNIYIVRHGQNEDNLNGILNGHRDLPLTKLGEEQAYFTGNHLKELDLRINKIYSSPLIRASKTAEIISVILGLEKPEILNNLIERDFGIMTGVEQNKILELCMPNVYVTSKINYFLDPKGAETFPDLIIRASKLIKELKNKHSDGNILLTTHGDFGKMLYCYYYNLNWKDVLDLFYFGNTEIIKLSENTNPENSHISLENILKYRHT